MISRPMLLACAAALALHGCGGPTAPPTPVVELDANARGEIRLAWQRDIGASSELLQAARAGGVLCAVNLAGQMNVLDLQTGDDASPPFQILEGTVDAGAGCNEEVAAAAGGSVLVAYSMDGMPLWSKDLVARVTTPPLVSGGGVYVNAHDGAIAAYSARRGELLWRYVSRAPGALRIALDSSPADGGPLIYAGLDNGSVVALRRETGRVAWQTRLSSPQSTDAFSNILAVTTPAVGGDVVCAAAYQGHLGCMAAGRGDLLWRAPLSAARRVALDIDAARVFAVDLEGGVQAYTAREGELLWRNDLGAASSAAFIRGALIVGLKGGGLAALAPGDGRVMAKLDMDGGTVEHLFTVSDDAAVGVSAAGSVFLAQFSL